MFLICGTVTDPQKEYHLEFSTPYLHLAEDLVAVLHRVKAAQLSPSIARRKNSYIVYIKESAAIEDFLTLTGAVNSAMNLMQIKMYKETYNNLNRVSNCETANLDKTYSAATKQIAAIALISDKVGLDELQDKIGLLVKQQNKQLFLQADKDVAYGLVVDVMGRIPDGSIDFDNVNFSYKHGSGKNALSGIDLHIRSGETIGVIGGTGSGKSSLVNLICRLYDVDEGCVKVGGVDVRRYDMEALRDQVAVVLQKNTLFSGTILENLRWGDPNATEAECVEACKAACADEFIDRMPDGYNTRIERGGNNVSGGQKQRLCIARALLAKPKILILDDSTSAVDTATDAAIREALRTHLKDSTKIIIAQRVASVCDADKIVVLNDGKIADMGTHDELMERSEIYREVYTSQQKGVE